MFELLETFETGDSHILRAEMLRVMPPSAEVQGHSPEQRVTVGGKRHVKIAHDLPIGNYAVRLVFDDGRDRRIFTWTYLMELCVNGATKWTPIWKSLRPRDWGGVKAARTLIPRCPNRKIRLFPDRKTTNL